MQAILTEPAAARPAANPRRFVLELPTAVYFIEVVDPAHPGHVNLRGPYATKSVAQQMETRAVRDNPFRVKVSVLKTVTPLVFAEVTL